MTDLSPAEIEGLLELASKMKKRSKRGRDKPVLAGQVLAMLFQKPSLRTRVSFEVGMEHLGGHALYLAPAEVGLGVRETAADVSRVLSRYAQGIMARVFKHGDLETMAQYASVPVINGLSDYDHPCQVMADLLTLREHIGSFAGKQLVFVGDGYNMANGLLFGASKLGLNIAVATPDAYQPNAEVMARAMEFSEDSGALIRWTTDPQEALHSADVVYTDVSQASASSPRCARCAPSPNCGTRSAEHATASPIPSTCSSATACR